MHRCRGRDEREGKILYLHFGVARISTCRHRPFITESACSWEGITPVCMLGNACLIRSASTIIGNWTLRAISWRTRGEVTRWYRPLPDTDWPTPTGCSYPSPIPSTGCDDYTARATEIQSPA